MKYSPNTTLTAFLLLSVTSLCGCLGEGSGKTKGLLSALPGISASDKYLPQSGQVAGLVRTNSPKVYRGTDISKYHGANANLYVGYGAEHMAACDYTLGGTGKGLTIEVYAMNQDVAAAGLFHYFRGRKLAGRSEAVDIGAEGVIDKSRQNRNLYFYKQRLVFKLIYSGTEPVPDLVPLAMQIAASAPGGKERPRGFEYLAIDGISTKNTRISAGYTFNYDFLPPGIFADAPAAGPISEVFLIGHYDAKDAAKTARDYRTYLELNGTNYALRYLNRNQILFYARDPQQGRIMCTHYKNYLIGVIRPKNYQLAENLIARIIAEMQRRK